MTVQTDDQQETHSYLFNMPCDLITLSAAADRVLNYASDDHPRLVVTPNSDHFLRWQRSEEFRELYSLSSLSVLDGMPLVWMANLLGGRRVERVTGIDLFSRVCQLAGATGVPVVIVGGMDGAAARARTNLENALPGLSVPIAESPSRSLVFDDHYLDQLAARLNEHPAKVVAICLGSPKQEQFFAELANRVDSGVFLGVGAAVDFWAGTVKRAPVWVQSLGLEWVFRLASEPRRLWRRYLVEDLPVLTYLARAAVDRFSAGAR